jgi:hypothetical protein
MVKHDHTGAKISAIIPAYHEQKHLGEALDDSLVLCQTEVEVLSTGLSLPHRNHSRLKAGLKTHHVHRDEPLEAINQYQRQGSDS